MSTHPFIPLYVDDFDAATAHLTIEEDGAYNRLIRLCWRTPGCSLPDDSAWIARKLRLSMDDFERVARPVLEEFFTILRGRYIQRRLKREYDDISRKKSARQQAGKLGGIAKSAKLKGKSSSNATELPSDTRAFPEPYPEPERELTLLTDTPLSKRSILDGHQADFDRWYDCYPRKEGKGAAEKAFKTAIKLVDVETMIAATATYAESVSDRERQHIKQPATWLNAKCWEDEPERPKREFWG